MFFPPNFNNSSSFAIRSVKSPRPTSLGNIFDTNSTMPGSSLWLVPPEDSELYKAIHELTVNNIPSIFPNENPPGFFPHITLTSNALTDPATEPSDKQDWLDGIPMRGSIKALKVAIQEVEVGKIFFKKVTMRCDKTHELCQLAAACRAAGVEGVDAEGAEKWVGEQYLPHCSLM